MRIERALFGAVALIAGKWGVYGAGGDCSGEKFSLVEGVAIFGMFLDILSSIFLQSYPVADGGCTWSQESPRGKVLTSLNRE